MSKKVLKILHIAPHLGCGVGSVIFKYLEKAKENKDFSHSIYLLGYADERTYNASKDIGFQFKDKMASQVESLLKDIGKSDIVVIHWWTHPLLMDFLIRNKLPSSRVVIWSHISGATAPNNFTSKILHYPDVFVFTTPLSYTTREVISFPNELRYTLRDIWSTGGIDHLKNIKKIRHNGFNVGYIGNVDYAKMHPEFLDISANIKIPNVKFTVVGGPNGKILQKVAEERKIDKKFNFTGFVSEEEKWNHLSTFDIFGYPLAPHHYGTCDQVLQEAMAVGVVPVVLANPMESYIVNNGVTGIVAKNTREYVKAIERLYHDKKLRDKLSQTARKHALKRFSITKMVNEWEIIFDELMELDKTEKRWKTDKKISSITYADVFLETLGEYGDMFAKYTRSKDKKEQKNALSKIKELALKQNWQSETKSSVHNFNTFLPGDKELELWSKTIRKYGK